MSFRLLPFDRVQLRGLLQQLVRVKPIEPKCTIGLDIGSTTIKVLALGSRRGGKTRPVIAQHVASLPTGDGADLSETLKEILASLNLPTRSVNISVSGPWVIMRVVELPSMSQNEIRQALPFEAQRYLPFNLQDVMLDGAVLGPAGNSKSWVLIVACKKDLIERRMDWIRRASLETGLIDVDALALTNSFLATQGSGSAEATNALINVGGQLANVVIFRGNLPYLVRDIPWGAEKMVRTVAEQTGAEAAVVQAALEKPEAPEGWQPALKLATEALATELQLSFDYFENRFGQPPAQLLLCGGLAQSTVFVESLKMHFTQPVTQWSPASGLSSQFAVAYGLALRGDT